MPRNETVWTQVVLSQLLGLGHRGGVGSEEDVFGRNCVDKVVGRLERSEFWVRWGVVALQGGNSGTTVDGMAGFWKLGRRMH